MKHRYTTAALTVLTIAWLIITHAASALAQTPSTQPSAEPRRVFAHYMTCYFGSIEYYKHEIELAQRHGIDGFALNCGAWGNRDPKSGEWVPDNYTKACERMYEAAKQLNSGFQLFISADVNGFGPPDKLEDVIRRFRDHPNQLRSLRGQPVVSTWGGSPEYFEPTLDRLAKEGVTACFVPCLFTSKFAMLWSPETAMRWLSGHPRMDGYFYFGADGPPTDILRTNAMGRRMAIMYDRIFMAGVTPAYNSANLRDWRGMQGYGNVWRGIVRDNPEWVEIVTWSDYNEDSNLNPYRWPAGGEKRYISRDESYLDVTGYYSAWFKSGQQPAITQDKVYVTYRNRSIWTRKGWDEKEKKWVDITMKEWPYDQIHDDAEDAVYLDTFLTAPAELKVELGGKEFKFAQPAGVGHAEVPLLPGVPRVALSRGGKMLVEFNGRKEIVGEPTEQNSPVGYHLLNRTWTQGAAVGPVTCLEAETGELANVATVTTMGKARGVVTTTQPSSGFTLPIKGLKTGTYNLRITYRNPSANEARLTLTADGTPRADKEHPYFLPAFFPPTKGDQSATTSVLWSLYDATTRLTLEWRSGAAFGAAKVEYDDVGTVFVDAIELVRVEPTLMPTPWPPGSVSAPGRTFPEMVEIPGGTFDMGSKDGQPDERPVHRVTLAPFRLGKFEVTNEQYEQFDPSHRKFRDGFSWRDREPVIYVSWNDGVKYCNWLSEKAGLTPAYREETDEKTKRKLWVLDGKATGYRLPSEAQWEYAASGRGEGRKYPWGKEEPDGTRCHSQGRESLRADVQLPATNAEGTMVVGTFPLGASRDGVMDLAGNVAEWCGDWFELYSDAAHKDPLGVTPGNYRAIRGGSWSWYSHSQRVADREFNNPQYPGLIWVGLRVALPGTK